jgi:hypothetical protein
MQVSLTKAAGLRITPEVLQVEDASGEAIGSGWLDVRGDTREPTSDAHKKHPTMRVSSSNLQKQNLPIDR